MTPEEISLIRQLSEKIKRLEKKLGLLDTHEGGTYTDEAAQDAVGNILLDSTTIDFTYADATPSITAVRAALTGDVTASANSNATTIAANAVTNAKAAQMAANTVKSNITGSTANAADNDITTVLAQYIHGATSKTTPVDADEIPIIDTAASNVLKKVTGTNWKAYLKTYFDTLYDLTGATITALATKTTPVDADDIVITDSAASNAPKRVTGTNYKAYFKTYFDTLYDLTATAIAALSGKITPIDADGFVISDSAASGAPKKVTGTNLKAYIKTYYDSVAATLTNKTLDSTNIASLTGKTTPVDADSVVIVDSAASNVFKAVTGTNWKAYIKAYVDTLYVALTGAQNVAGVKTFTDGISFGSETLNVYDEGTWTPVLRFGAATTGITYTVQTGTYTRIGRFVFAYCAITLSSKGSATGNADISGLPFTVSKSTEVAVRWSSMTTSLANVMSIFVAGGTTIAIDGITAATASFNTQLANTDFANTTFLRFQGVYEV